MSDSVQDIFLADPDLQILNLQILKVPDEVLNAPHADNESLLLVGLGSDGPVWVWKDMSNWTPSLPFRSYLSWRGREPECEKKEDMD